VSRAVSVYQNLFRDEVYAAATVRAGGHAYDAPVSVSDGGAGHAEVSSAQAGECAEQDWNQHFQSALDMPESTAAEVAAKYQWLAQLSLDFVQTVRTYARVIISEQFLPREQMTVKPTDIGGSAGACAYHCFAPADSVVFPAGGLKYIVRGLLFKLVVDPPVPVPAAAGQPMRQRYIYGGSQPVYEWAAKASQHDLKGAAAYFRAAMATVPVGARATVRVPIQAGLLCSSCPSAARCLPLLLLSPSPGHCRVSRLPPDGHAVPQAGQGNRRPLRICW
jgi:hypothetical protein